MPRRIAKGRPRPRPLGLPKLRKELRRVNEKVRAGVPGGGEAEWGVCGGGGAARPAGTHRPRPYRQLRMLGWDCS